VSGCPLPWRQEVVSPSVEDELIIRPLTEVPMLTDAYLRFREAFNGALDHAERDDEDGQGMVEYALILVLIAVVVIVVLTVLGNQVSNLYSNISSGIGT
jgi:pilus assembly protein Flp/PilA